jgi:thioredoxin 1
MTAAAMPTKDVFVVVLCAAWCGVCTDYRAHFERALLSFDEANWRWVDIEDEADLLGPVDVEDFPTVLVAVGGTPLFFGPLGPQPEVLDRLVRACMSDRPPAPVTQADVVALASRLGAASGE